MTQTPVTYEMLAAKLVELRARKSAIQQEADSKIEVLEDAMATIRAELNRLFNEHGMESVRTAQGTVYRQLKTSYQLRDAGALFQMVKETGTVELLQRRLATQAIEEYKQANNGELPPGVHQEQAYEIVVRKS